MLDNIKIYLEKEWNIRILEIKNTIVKKKKKEKSSINFKDCGRKSIKCSSLLLNYWRNHKMLKSNARSIKWHRKCLKSINNQCWNTTIKMCLSLKTRWNWKIYENIGIFIANFYYKRNNAMKEISSSNNH